MVKRKEVYEGMRDILEDSNSQGFHGHVEADEGVTIKINGCSYSLKSVLNLVYDDYRCSGAAIFIQNLLHNSEDKVTSHSQFERFPAGLEEGDVNLYAQEYLFSLVRRFHSLRAQEDVKGQDERDLARLSDIFEIVE